MRSLGCVNACVAKRSTQFWPRRVFMMMCPQPVRICVAFADCFGNLHTPLIRVRTGPVNKPRPVSRAIISGTIARVPIAARA